ncbi:uncharacterized protein BDZ99DRAFT_475897 [Mytilinidion resinicola]|uniref:Uncharacterized protein n=1 Tax=Mytilinidion resinicola TaxID=574789 RepID=A0A6A6YSV9_9PEZI|nr:uncharacterized protein BDZ99DRAFT_475897 [Mytilinidion resinicola]KAF2811045.1 hypothetical protein BDZ99DRAFT_475897 [Mytilinidion resinicola]
MARRYQERMLSKRCLYFINGQVFFQCRRETWREDMFLEGIQVIQSVDTLAAKHAIDANSIDANPHSDYAGSLYEYSGRILTWHSDVLAAFSGMLNMYLLRMRTDRNDGIDHFFGLPVAVFDWALQWNPNRAVRRRPGKWPSWSWCGWIGRVTMPYFSNYKQLLDWCAEHTWIEWIGYEGLKPATRLLSHSAYNRNTYRFPHHEFPPVAEANIETRLAASTEIPPGSEALGIDHPVLHFCTLAICLRVRPIEKFSDMPRPQSGAFEILDASAAPCGHILINSTLSYNSDSMGEFLLLSDARSKDVRWKEDPGTVFHDDDWGAYQVMLVQRFGGRALAERVAIGVILQKAVENAVASGVEWKEIWLV